jgi:hypothetical protein
MPSHASRPILEFRDPRDRPLHLIQSFIVALKGEHRPSYLQRRDRRRRVEVRISCPFVRIPRLEVNQVLSGELRGRGVVPGRDRLTHPVHRVEVAGAGGGVCSRAAGGGT